MKLWERQILEYRPRLGYKSEILSKVEKKEIAVFKPSPVAVRATKTLGVDVVDNLMASLSRANAILDSIDKCLNNDPTYQSYKQAKADGDDMMAEAIYRDNLQNINGKTQLDVVPLLEETRDEMEAYLEFVNQELFNGEVDYNDTASARKKEEESIDTILRLESEQRPVDYKKLRSRVSTVAAMTERSNFYKDTLDKSDEYLLTKAKDYVDQDTAGLVKYIASIPEEKTSLLQESVAVQFRTNATGAINERINMSRLADREFREALDTRMSDVRKKMHEVYDGLYAEYADNTLRDPGAEHFKSVFMGGLEQIRETFDYLVTENISTTVLNREQNTAYFDKLNEKKKAQTMHQIVGLIGEELDRSNPDKEVDRFIRTHRLDAPGTYCG